MPTAEDLQHPAAALGEVRARARAAAAPAAPPTSTRQAGRTSSHHQQRATAQQRRRSAPAWLGDRREAMAGSSACATATGRIQIRITRSSGVA